MQHGCSASSSTRARSLARTTVLTLGIAMVFSTVSISRGAAATTGGARDFLRSIVGEWVGTCRQSTDGQQAEDKYFHAVITQTDPDTFSTSFEYYRLQNGTPLRIGTSSITTTVGQDGTASNHITGEGTVLVEKKPRNQRHDFTETVKASADNSLEGQGAGTISVSGLPMGIGKNGKIKDSKSSWTLNNDTLTIDQSIKAGFKVLFFSKNFSVTARYTAVRGTDVASVMPEHVQQARQPSTGVGGAF